KVAAQQSAAVDAAKKRRMDRAPTDVALDERDKDAARLMLGKKKKKKKRLRFYRQGWFTILALTGMLGILATCIFFAFIRAPDADNLYALAQKRMESSSEEDHKAAFDGPLAAFLRYHPGDKRAAQVRAW